MRNHVTKVISQVLLLFVAVAFWGSGIANAQVTDYGLDITAIKYVRSETDNYTLATIDVNIKNVNNRTQYVSLEKFGLKLEGYNVERPSTQGIYWSTLNSKSNSIIDIYPGDIIPGQLVFYFRGRVDFAGARLYYDDSGLTLITRLTN